MEMEQEPAAAVDPGEVDVSIEEAERLLKLICEGDAQRAVELINGQSDRAQKLRGLLVSKETADWAAVEEKRLNAILPAHEKLQQEIIASLQPSLVRQPQKLGGKRAPKNITCF